jgi:cellulose synthase (UDP-forming)
MTFYLILLGVVCLTTMSFGLLPLLDSPPPPSAAGVRMRNLRLNRKLTLGALAAHVGLPARLIAEIELGLRPAPAPLVPAIEAALGVNPGALADLAQRPTKHALPWHGRGRLFKAAIASGAMAANVVLLWLLTPVSRPDVSIWLLAIPAAAITGSALWYAGPRSHAKAPHVRNAGVLLVLASQIYALFSIYLVWSQPTLVTVLHAVAVSWNALTTCLSIFNQLWPRDERRAPPLPYPLPEVAAVIPTYGEPIEVLARVVRSVAALDYPREKLHILISDDGRRPEVEILARRCGVGYCHGPRLDAKAGNLNQAVARIRAEHPTCDLILTQDADDVLAPGFLKAVLGYFADPLVAFVQTPKDCEVPEGDLFGNRERIFYDSLQVGRNGANASFACGSGVVWRISAVEAVGGFSTWNLVEDLTTSYLLHRAGFSSRYHNEVFSVGLAPDDIPGILKQRGTWAVDTLRLFFFDNPLLCSGRLSLRQRLQYMEQGLFYLSSAIVTPLLFLVPVLALLSGQFIQDQGTIALLWSLVTAANLYYYSVLSDGRPADTWRTWQYIVGHSPTYIRAILVALGSRARKPQYVVTRKTRASGFYGSLLWPQFAAIAVGVVSAVYGALAFGREYPWHVAANCAFVGYYVAMLAGICRAAFYGVSVEELPVIGWLVRRWRAGSGQVSLPAGE